MVIYNKNNSIWDKKLFFELSGDYNSRIEWYDCEFSELSTCFNLYENTMLVLDLTEGVESQFFILKLCKEKEISHLVFENKLNYFDQWFFSIKPSLSDQTNSFLTVLKYFDWTQGLIINNEKKNYWKEKLEKYSENLNYLTIEQGANIDNLVKKVITPLGESLYYVFMKSTESLKLQNALIDTNLLSGGNGIVLDQQSGYGCIADGALIITVKEEELSSSDEEYLKSSIKSIVAYLLSHIKTESSLEIRYQLDLLSENHYFTRDFSLVNIQNGERVVVGEIIDGELSLIKEINFPGNSKDIPKSQRKILQLSIEAGSTNPIGPPITVGQIGGYGSYAARDIINEGSGLLENFKISLFNFDCGVTIYNSTFANACYLQSKEKFGLAHVSAWASVMAIGSMKSFKELNLTFPTISASNGDVTLNSTSKYPMYMRIQPSFSYEYSLIPIFIRALGWRKVAVLYQNDTWGLSGYVYFDQGSKSHDLTIVNSEPSRAFPGNLNRNEIKNYLYILKDIVNSEARFLILIMQYPTAYYIFEEFYDLGLRKGDLVIFTSLSDLISFSAYDNAYKYKLYEIAVPIMTGYGESWVGPLGAKALSQIENNYGGMTNSYSCFYFDAVFLIVYALDFMINRGMDYTDPYKLQNIMRKQQFYGCTGQVNIEKGSNDRIIQTFEVFVNKIDEHGNLTTYVMGQFRPQSIQLITIQEPLIYADGSTVKPSDLRNSDYKCPFPDRLVKTFAKGRALLFGICFGAGLICLATVVYIWHRWWKISIEPLRRKEEISIQDVIVGATIFIEFFQFSSMGPDFTVINTTLRGISELLSLSLSDFLKLQNGVFWIVVDIVFGSIGLWVILCLVVLLRLDEKFPTIVMLRHIDALADYLMPILGNLCFIPFISVCLDIFLCDQSIGENFTDSFLAWDCYYFCWKGEHLIYAHLSVIALIIYAPLAIFCRPLWQELQPLLHVKAIPVFLMVKTMIQIILIVMNKTIKRAQSNLHGALFLLVMLFYISFLFRIKPYNYARYSWWQILILIGVVWLAFLSIIGGIVESNQFILSTILCSGLIVIILIGIYVQYKKYPSLLYRKKGHDTSTIFKFAFAFGKHSKLALRKIVPIT